VSERVERGRVIYQWRRPSESTAQQPPDKLDYIIAFVAVKQAERACVLVYRRHGHAHSTIDCLSVCLSVCLLVALDDCRLYTSIADIISIMIPHSPFSRNNI